MDTDYRAYVGPADKYDVIGALQFCLLFLLGLREHHLLLDVGCGSLRAGRLFLPYLSPGNYHGIEPAEWLVEEGVKNEVGEDMIAIKKPKFAFDADFNFGIFNARFDFILAQSIFSHTSQPQIRKCLSQARKVMKPTSIFAATYFEGDENYSGDAWVYPGHVTYTLERLVDFAGEQGLTCKPLDWPHPSQKWLLFVEPGGEVNLPELGNPNRLPFSFVAGR